MYSWLLSVQLEPAFNIKVFRIDKKPGIKVQEFFYLTIFLHELAIKSEITEIVLCIRLRTWRLHINLEPERDWKFLAVGKITYRSILFANIWKMNGILGGWQVRDWYVGYIAWIKEFFCSIIQQPWCTTITHLEYLPFLIQMNQNALFEPTRWHIPLNIPEGRR